MNPDNQVSLTAAEMLLAISAGGMRQIENCKRNRDPYHGAGTERDWQLHMEGALGEMALCKWLGVYWPGKGGLRDADIGVADVRTGARHTHSLILHREDSDDREFWLVTGINGKYVIRGWICGRDGKSEKYWKDPGTGRPAFFVPQSALNPPDRSHVWKQITRSIDKPTTP